MIIPLEPTPFQDRSFLEGYEKGFNDCKNMIMCDLKDMYDAVRVYKAIESVTITIDSTGVKR